MDGPSPRQWDHRYILGPGIWAASPQQGEGSACLPQKSISREIPRRTPLRCASLNLEVHDPGRGPLGQLWINGRGSTRPPCATRDRGPGDGVIRSSRSWWRRRCDCCRRATRLFVTMADDGFVSFTVARYRFVGADRRPPYTRVIHDASCDGVLQPSRVVFSLSTLRLVGQYASPRARVAALI